MGISVVQPNTQKFEAPFLEKQQSPFDDIYSRLQGGWIKGYYQSEKGWCLLGAIYGTEIGGDSDQDKLNDRVHKCFQEVLASDLDKENIEEVVIPTWNDEEERTFADILEVVSRARDLWNRKYQTAA